MPTITARRSLALCALALLAGCHARQTPERTPEPTPARPTRSADALELGNFSVSLSVKDLAASRAFYEKLGFRVKGGVAEQGWLILQNATSTIGLFQGLFPRNMLTFNPGWDRDGITLADFQDVRELQAQLQARGIAFDAEADANSTGPASFVITDPDGNPILVDQHVARPAR
jgi:catechol 2,3-dioxygenase-like lactoylglutathione lyase family enzyme